MKKILLLIATIAFFSITAQAQNPKAKAIVNSTQGILLFVDCLPTEEYEIIGREKASITFTGSYYEMRNKLVKKALKEYPNADGIIIEFGASEYNASRAIIIKFKDKKSKE